MSVRSCAGEEEEEQCVPIPVYLKEGGGVWVRERERGGEWERDWICYLRDR